MNNQDKNNMTNINNSGEIIIYEGVDGAPNIEVRMKNETVWLSQKQMAELFDKNYFFGYKMYFSGKRQLFVKIT